jgi:hypothetical protein
VRPVEAALVEHLALRDRTALLEAVVIRLEELADAVERLLA